ncbi:aspartyl protease family protein [Porphyromonas macacae]|nr:aspartyl protease family protein [Porphyromonas macacae]
MKMKCILLSILSVVITTTAFAQDRAECERIAGVVFEAVGKQDMTQIKPHLSEKFEISGQTTPVAEKVLEMLVGNLGGIKSFTLTEARTDATGLTLNYDVEYEKKGKKQAFFEFNEKNKIRRMELLKIEVKTAKTDPSKIQYNPENVIEIPFTRMGRLIIVKASINGIEKDFILDSGSGFTIINSKYMEKDTTTDAGTNKTVLSSAKGVHDESLSGTNIVKASIDFYGTRVDEQDMLTHDISHLEIDGRPIYGLIGHDLLRKYDVLYDYDRKVITLINPDYFETYRKEKFSGHLIETVPLEWRGHIPIVSIEIGGSYRKMGIDCGATVNLLDVELLPQMKGYLKKIKTRDLGGASINKKNVTHAILKRFYVGTTLYKNTETVFSNIAHLNKDKEVKLDGLLGYEFLSKRPTLLSYQRKELLLIK